MAPATVERFAAALLSVLSDLDMSLKPQQLEALITFFLKKDVFAVLPTDFGKSLIYLYQLAYPLCVIGLFGMCL